MATKQATYNRRIDEGRCYHCGSKNTFWTIMGSQYHCRRCGQSTLVGAKKQ